MNPFDIRHHTDGPIGGYGEGRLIADIRQWLGETAPAAPEGPGDDCAVLESAPGKTLFTIDSVVYGRHFDKNVSAEQAGAKLLKRNVSDIAAMGGAPTCAVVAITCGKDLSRAWLEGFCRGMAAGAKAWGVRLVGGDISGASEGTFSASMALLGHAEKPLLRTGAAEGDFIFVTGELGGSLTGWHFDFVPRVREGAWLAAHARPSSMMDLTDGLAKDLPDLIPEGCDAFLDTAILPLRTPVTSLGQALCDGEDYELLFTLPKAHLHKLDDWNTAFPQTRLTRIGRMQTASDPQKTKRLRDKTTGQPLDVEGFSHF